MKHGRRLARLASLIVLAFLPAAVPVLAAAVDPALFAGLHWRLIGPFRGGRVLAVSGVPGEPEHFYFGSVNGGVWETLRRRPHLEADLRRPADRQRSARSRSRRRTRA